MMWRWFYLVLAFAMVGCVSGTPQDPAPPSAPAINIAWDKAISTAKLDPAYAGSYVEDQMLWVGFTQNAQAKLAAITNQSNIRAYTARHNAIELDKAFKATVALLSVSRFGPTSANIDFRKGAMTVGTAYSLQDAGGPTPACSTLIPLPKTAPNTDIELIDVRDCKK